MANDIKQRDIFVQSEADAWYDRNKEACVRQDFSEDQTSVSVVEIAQLSCNIGNKLKILEIGCSEGWRLAWLADKIGAEVFGIEPSKKAVTEAIKRGLKVSKGTADALPFEDSSFDILIFGSCLCLCDQEDLFRIAQEADRVLKAESWLIIADFYSPVPTRRIYHHKSGVYTYKMDFRNLFLWHPAYTCYSHKVTEYETNKFGDIPSEWQATSVLRKKKMIE